MGSGYRYRSSKSTTSDFHALDIRWLHRRGLLKPGTQSNIRWSRNYKETGSIGLTAEMDSVRLSYRHARNSDEWESKKYSVGIDWTSCNYGGSRPWFLCPVVGCGRRVAILYGGGIFACRHCYGLNYETQHEQAWDRALSRCQKIRAKLGGHPGDAYPFPAKPKGMHWRTYERWCMKANQAESVSWPNWLYRLLPSGVKNNVQ